MINEITSFIIQPQIMSFIFEYTTTKGIEGIAYHLARKSEHNSLEWQFVTALEAALQGTCKQMGWEYDDNAISDTFLFETYKAIDLHTDTSLQTILCSAVGQEVNDETLRAFIIYFHEAVAHPERNLLYRFLSMEELFHIRRQLLGGNIRESDSISALTPALHAYFLAEIERYKSDDILIKTPQILLSLLKYPGSVLYRVLSEYSTSSGNYADYLLEFFQEECDRYKRAGYRYNSDCVIEELLCLENAYQLSKNVGKRNISENLISYSVLNNDNSNTIQALKQLFGQKLMEEIKRKLLSDATPRIFI